MKRPFSVTILLYLVLSLIAWSALRLIAILRWWQTLQTYSGGIWPPYVAVSAVFWLTIGLTLLWGLIRKNAWVQNMLPITGAGYTVWYWCDRLFIQWPHANWLFALIANILLLLIGMISLKHSKTKNFLERETHDR
ncbi:MAG: hypothetical protein Kow002_09030 [Anaerolineales bacterium]